MANRFIKSSIWTSPNLNNLSDVAELFFYRLLPLPDDHGCFGADPRVLKGLLFPLKDSWTIEIIGNQLIALEDVEIIMLWAVDKRLYGTFHNWGKHQTIRSKFKRKTPEPPGKSSKVDAHKLLEDIVNSCNQLNTVVSSSPSSLLPPPSSLPSSLNDIPPKADSVKKRTDPIRDIYLDSIITEIKKKFKSECTYPQAGAIIKMAGGIHEYNLWGYMIIAIDKVSKWRTEEEWFGALKTELRRVYTDWSDDERQRLAKSFSDKKRVEIDIKMANVN